MSEVNAGFSKADPNSIIIEGMFNGLPYRGPVLYLQENDPEWKLPRLRRSAHVGIFDLSDDTQRLEYENICSKIAEGQLARSWEDIAKVEQNGRVKWVACIRYVEEWYGPPVEVTKSI